MYLRIYNMTMFCIFSKLISQKGELTLQKGLILKTTVYWKELLQWRVTFECMTLI